MLHDELFSHLTPQCADPGLGEGRAFDFSTRCSFIRMSCCPALRQMTSFNPKKRLKPGKYDDLEHHFDSAFKTWPPSITCRWLIQAQTVSDHCAALHRVWSNSLQNMRFSVKFFFSDPVTKNADFFFINYYDEIFYDRTPSGADPDRGEGCAFDNSTHFAVFASECLAVQRWDKWCHNPEKRLKAGK